VLGGQKAKGDIVEGLVQEGRQAVRSLLRHILVPVLGIVALGLGVGANTAVFSIVYATLLRPLPVPEPGSVVLLFEHQMSTGEDTMISPAVYAAWDEQSRSFSALSPVGFQYYTVTGAGEPQFLLGARIDSDFFDVMGIEPVLGRGLLPADDRPGAPPVALLRHSYWTSRFGADPHVVGRAVNLDGVAHRVVGVMPPGFVYPSRAEVWVPARFDAEELSIRWRYLFAAGRLGPGSTVEVAQAELAATVERLAAQHPENHQGWTARVQPLQEVLVAGARPALFVLLGAVGLVLLVACANVAALLLVRALSRRREMALRSAVGASRPRLVRLVLVESLLLATAGGIAGLGLAVVGTDALVALLGSAVPAHAEVNLDWAVLRAATILALASTLLFGTAPALRAARLDLVSALKSRETGPRGGLLPLRTIVAAEIALTMMVLIAAGLLTRSFLHLRGVDPGFAAEGVLAVPAALPQGSARYPGDDERRAFFREALGRLAALPGVTASGAIDAPPLVWPASVSSFTLRGRPATRPDERPQAHVRVVMGDYFSALGIPLTSGRGLAESDREGAPAVAVVDQTLAHRHWPGQDPVGKRIVLDDIEREIVGVVGSVRQRHLTGEATPTLYLPAGQEARGALTIMLRTAGPPANLAEAARRTLWAIDPELPLEHVEPMAERVRAEAAEPRAMAQLLGLFGLLALVLAALGVYGVMSYTSLLRVPEIGLRLALGARRSQVLRLVSGEALALVGVGILVGWGGALLANRWLASLLVGIQRGDPVVHLATALLLASVALAASYLPGRRATHIDPITVLGAE
jgi:predicted permease